MKHPIPLIWKDIPGYEGKYQASNYGNIKSLKRKVTRHSQGVDKSYIKEEILLTKSLVKGRYRVGLTVDGKTTIKGVCRLIALTFLSNPENKPDVNHIDFDQTNDCVQNLEWVTKSENQAHSYQMRNLFCGIRNNSYVYVTVSQDVEPIKKGGYVICNNKVYKIITTDVLYFGDFTLETDIEGVFLNPKHCNKIIATTDPKLTIIDFDRATGSKFQDTPFKNIPQVQQSFLEEFVVNPDGEFEVEYEYIFNVDLTKDEYSLKLKLNQDNTVNITSVKEKMYTEKQLVEAMKAMNKHIIDTTTMRGKDAKSWSIDWIKENL